MFVSVLSGYNSLLKVLLPPPGYVPDSDQKWKNFENGQLNVCVCGRELRHTSMILELTFVAETPGRPQTSESTHSTISWRLP